jgi:hypothetical protein
MVDNIIDNINTRAYKKYQVVENFITLSIEEAGQILYGLSLTLASEGININNRENLYSLIKNFDSKYRYRSIPFYAFKLIDHNDINVLHTLIPKKVFNPEKLSSDLKLLKSAKKKSFELQVGNIRTALLSQDKIIPMCMAIEKNSTYIGSICSGLIIKDLSSRLDQLIKEKNIINIELLPLDNKKYISEINTNLTFINIISAALKGESLIMYLHLKSYPALLKAEINCYYLSREIGEVIFFAMSYFAILLLLTYAITFLNKKFYQQPFNGVIEKLHKRSSIFTEISPELYTSIKKFCPSTLSKAIGHIIDYCSELHKNAEQIKLKKPTEELRKNILHLILTEYHYNKLYKSDVEPGILYLNELDKLVSSKEEHINIREFLEELISYCAEYYSDLKLKLIIEDENPICFTSKRAFLTEAIFNIISSIIRIGKLNLEEFIVLRSNFYNNSLPSFNIEVLVSESLDHPLGWEYGLDYAYTGLLAVHLLAKNNNYFFFVEQENDKALFKIQPFDDKKLESTNELCMNLPLHFINGKQ